MQYIAGFYLAEFFFFFKQKTAYEMRISDWSSDACSSDLLPSLRPSSTGGLRGFRPPAAPGGTGTSGARTALNGILWLVLGAMLVQQTFTTWGKVIVSVIGPEMTTSLGLAPELVGVFVAISGLAGTVAADRKSPRLNS